MASNVAAYGTATSRFVKYWLPVLVMIGLMYYASTDFLSGENTRGIIERILEWLAPDTSPRTVTRINALVRKIAHPTEYALLAWLLFRAFRADSLIRWRTRWVVYSLVTCTAWALVDEFHQRLTRTRGGSIRDSLLDTVGATAMLTLITVYHFAVARRKTSAE